MERSKLSGFHVVQHTHRLSRNGGSRAGYHCPDCGCFYAEGNFTIENVTYVLGVSTPEQKSCCGKTRATPRLFETAKEVRDFVSKLETSCTQEKAILIERCSLNVAHFNQTVVMEHKRKTLH